MTDALSQAPTIGIAKTMTEGRFRVPPHQRDYSWTVDEVRELFEDIEEAIAKKKDSYFLGLLVLLTGKDRSTILDGQQRLATLAIIFAAIRDWLKQYPDHAEDAGRIQDRYIGTTELGEDDITPVMVLNTANNPNFFKFVVTGASIDDVIEAKKKLKKHDANKALLDAIIFAHERVKEIAKKRGADKAAKYFFAMIRYFTENVRTVRLIVTDENAAYTLFETLNDRGVDLSPLDLVKNFLFGRASEISSTALTEIQMRWVQMIATLVNVKATSFLKAFWTSRHGRIRTNLLFDTFRSEYVKPAKAVALSSDLLAAAEQYAAFESADDQVWSAYSKETRTTVASLKLLGAQQAHPVILSGLERFSVSEMQKLLRLLEVCIVRFLLVGGGNPGRFEPACARLAERIFKKEIKTAKEAFAELKDKEVCPNDAEFEAAFRVKSERNNQKAQYFLKAVEKETQRQALGKMGNELEPAALTVEHILPKKPGPDWSAVLKTDKELVDECVARLGNLCLLTDVNEKLGNKSFAVKKATFRFRFFSEFAIARSRSPATSSASLGSFRTTFW